MRRLVIDDVRDFGPDFDYARNLETAGKMLANWNWDQVWLDNDLGGDEEVYTLVKEIERLFNEENITLDVSLFVIHTANPVAREKMVRAFAGMPYPFVVADPTNHLVTDGRLL